MTVSVQLFQFYRIILIHNLRFLFISAYKLMYALEDELFDVEMGGTRHRIIHICPHNDLFYEEWHVHASTN